jgi:hypothetical protein
MKKLELQKSEIELELNELSARHVLNPPVEFTDYKSLLQKIRHGFDGADDALKARIVTTLMKRIEILPASIRVHYRMGKGDFSIDLKSLKRAERMWLEVPPPPGRHREKRGLQTNSNTACNGGPGRNRTCNYTFGGCHEIHFTTGPLTTRASMFNNNFGVIQES